jgi:hypothetical protein
MAARRTARARSIPLVRRRLARVVRDLHGTALATRDDAQRYVLDKLHHRPRYRSWQFAGELLRDGGDTELLTRQLEYAMLLDGILDLRPARR